MKDLSIIIPVFNKFNFTQSCLNDLSKLSEQHEIIVIDNGSNDQTKLELENNSSIIYIRNDDNFGFGKACNIAFSKSSRNNILFLNNDIRVKDRYSDWTDILIKECIDDLLIGPTGGFVDPKHNFNFCYETNDKNKLINYMSGWCLAGTRNTFNKLKLENELGPFDSQNFFCYFEDTDLSFRSQLLGIKFKIVDVPVVHFGKITSSSMNLGALYTNAKHKFISKWKKAL